MMRESILFFFSSRRRHTRSLCDWSSDVCSSDLKKAIQHISFDPRVSPPVMQAFEAAEDDVLKNTLQGAARLNVPNQFALGFLAEAEKSHPEYFSDLPSLPSR